jgi:predicted nuclease of predicted toxin-antitoxin system
MKLLVDAQLPVRLALVLQSVGCDTIIDRNESRYNFSSLVTIEKIETFI